MVLPKFTFVVLCFPFLSPLPRRWRFVVAPFHGFTEDLVTAAIAEVFITLSFSLKHSVNTENEVHLIVGVHAITSESSYLHVAARTWRDIFHALLSIMLFNGASIRKYKAYWHIYFSLINGCGTHENNNHGHSFFWIDTCEFTNIIIFTKKSLYCTYTALPRRLLPQSKTQCSNHPQPAFLVDFSGILQPKNSMLVLTGIQGMCISIVYKKWTRPVHNQMEMKSSLEALLEEFSKNKLMLCYF